MSAVVPLLIGQHRAGFRQCWVALRRTLWVSGHDSDGGLIGFKKGFHGFHAHVAKAKHDRLDGTPFVQQRLEGRCGQTQHGFRGVGETEVLSNRPVGCDDVLEKGRVEMTDQLAFLVEVDGFSELRHHL